MEEEEEVAEEEEDAKGAGERSTCETGRDAGCWRRAATRGDEADLGSLWDEEEDLKAEKKPEEDLDAGAEEGVLTSESRSPCSAARERAGLGEDERT